MEDTTTPNEEVSKGVLYSSDIEDEFVKDKIPKKKFFKSFRICDLRTCNKKLSIVQEVAGSCRCGGVFCEEHTYSKSHRCSFPKKIIRKPVRHQRLYGTTGTQISTDNKSSKTKAKRCQAKGCPRRVTAVEQKLRGVCGCGKIFCPEHKTGDNHNCNYQNDKKRKRDEEDENGENQSKRGKK